MRSLIIAMIAIQMWIGVALATPPINTDCTTSAAWYLETTKMSAAFSQLQRLDLKIQENITQAVVGYYTLYFQLLLLEVPECGLELQTALLNYVRDYGEITMFLMLSQSLHLQNNDGRQQMKLMLDQAHADGKIVQDKLKAFSDPDTLKGEKRDDISR